MLRKQISSLPSWILSGLTLVLILWLTLSPDPLGNDTPRLFPGADKVVHAIMFGFLTLMLLLDWQRSRRWRQVTGKAITGSACISTLTGIAIEFAQLHMDMGRGFEISDMVADATGALLCALVWKTMQARWSH